MSNDTPISLDELERIEREHEEHCPFDCCGLWSGDGDGPFGHSNDCLFVRMLAQIRRDLTE